MEFVFTLNKTGNVTDKWMNTGVYLIGSRYSKKDFKRLRNCLFNTFKDIPFYGICHGY